MRSLDDEVLPADPGEVEAQKEELLGQLAILRQAQDTFSSPGWKHVEATLQLWRDRALNNLVTENDVSKLPALQGYTRACESILGLPENNQTVMSDLLARLKEFEEETDAEQ